MKGLHYIKWASNAKDGGATYKNSTKFEEGASYNKEGATIKWREPPYLEGR